MDSPHVKGGYRKLVDVDGGAEAKQSPSGRSSSYGQPSKQSTGRIREVASVVQEVFPPFLLAGLGMVAAGLLLRKVHRWPVFQEADEMLILVPALLGLKGNLEMTLAARLSTHANLGHMDAGGQLFDIVVGNVAVVLCQAIVVGFLASLVAVALDTLTADGWHAMHLLLLSSSAVTAASTASVLLAAVMILIVLMARRFGINPDNVASPIAGMLGDFCTLGLLAMFADLYWSTQLECLWPQWMANAFFCVLAPCCARVAFRNKHTASVLREGWTPVILSMLLSSFGGLILKHAVRHFVELAPFAPVTNGAGGNLAAVQSSRLSTDLHSHGELGTGVIPGKPPRLTSKGHVPLHVEDDEPLTPTGTFSALFKSDNHHACTARILISLAVPGALCFVFLIVGVRSQGSEWPDPLFMVLYICAVLMQVSLLFVAAHGIVNTLWRRNINPDNAAIPYVTSLGDVVGTTCLTAAFCVLQSLGGSTMDGPA
uniref:SLC41A/MgtE integral membrane domain-containing protein n=1 Tax=Alexandrium monilatum TaxID=311494 RepID=A0A7S4SYB8_9DINO